MYLLKILALYRSPVQVEVAGRVQSQQLSCVAGSGCSCSCEENLYLLTMLRTRLVPHPPFPRTRMLRLLSCVALTATIAGGEGLQPTTTVLPASQPPATAAAAAAATPTLKFVSTTPVPMDLSSKEASFEGGTLLRTDTGLHLFTTDTSRGLNTSLVYYHAPPGKNFTYVRELACCSSATTDGSDQRASLWAPMPSWDVAGDVWRLFYVEYRSALPSNPTAWYTNSSGWFWNYDGQIVSAVSTVAGSTGIGGPYKDAGVVLAPGALKMHHVFCLCFGFFGVVAVCCCCCFGLFSVGHLVGGRLCPLPLVAQTASCSLSLSLSLFI